MQQLKETFDRNDLQHVALLEGTFLMKTTNVIMCIKITKEIFLDTKF